MSTKKTAKQIQAIGTQSPDDQKIFGMKTRAKEMMEFWSKSISEEAIRAQLPHVCPDEIQLRYVLEQPASSDDAAIFAQGNFCFTDPQNYTTLGNNITQSSLGLGRSWPKCPFLLCAIEIVLESQDYVSEVPVVLVPRSEVTTTLPAIVGPARTGDGLDSTNGILDSGVWLDRVRKNLINNWALRVELGCNEVLFDASFAHIGIPSSGRIIRDGSMPLNHTAELGVVNASQEMVNADRYALTANAAAACNSTCPTEPLMVEQSPVMAGGADYLGELGGRILLETPVCLAPGMALSVCMYVQPGLERAQAELQSLLTGITSEAEVAGASTVTAELRSVRLSSEDGTTATFYSACGDAPVELADGDAIPSSAISWDGAAPVLASGTLVVIPGGTGTQVVYTQGADLSAITGFETVEQSLVLGPAGLTRIKSGVFNIMLNLRGSYITKWEAFDYFCDVAVRNEKLVGAYLGSNVSNQFFNALAVKQRKVGIGELPEVKKAQEGRRDDLARLPAPPIDLASTRGRCR